MYLNRGWLFILADVLEPQLRASGDEVRHQLTAPGVVDQGDGHAVPGQPVLPAGERGRLADHQAGDPELAQRENAEYTQASG